MAAQTRKHKKNKIEKCVKFLILMKDISYAIGLF